VRTATLPLIFGSALPRLRKCFFPRIKKNNFILHVCIILFLLAKNLKSNWKNRFKFWQENQQTVVHAEVCKWTSESRKPKSYNRKNKYKTA